MDEHGAAVACAQLHVDIVDNWDIGLLQPYHNGEEAQMERREVERCRARRDANPAESSLTTAADKRSGAEPGRCRELSKALRGPALARMDFCMACSIQQAHCEKFVVIFVNAARLAGGGSSSIY